MGSNDFDINAFPVGCVLTDNNGFILNANRYMQADLGFNNSALEGDLIDTLFSSASRLLLESFVHPTIQKNGGTDEILLTVENAAEARFPVVINVRRNPDRPDHLCWTLTRAEKRHQLHGALAKARDTFEQRAAQLRKLAATDELTGLNNRREFLSRAGMAFRDSTINGTSVCLLMVDIDHFKKVNDTYGHAAGDDVLRQIGKLFHGACTADELVARYGGEEFIFCVEGASPSKIEHFADQLHETAARVETRGRPLTISIGLSFRFGGEQKTLLETLRNADLALYEAKNSGRNATFISDGETVRQIR